QRPRVGDLDRLVVELAIAGDPRVTPARYRTPGRVELRRVRFEIAVEIPDRRIGVEVAAVVEFNASTQVKNPLRLVVLILLPAFGEPRPNLRQLVGPRQIPQHQPLVYGIAEKPQALEAIVGRPGGGWHIRGSHRDPQCPTGL